jgi:hypothetical protein
LQATEQFARAEDNQVIAKRLRISVRSVQRWRKVWQDGRQHALRSKGPAWLPVLSDAQFSARPQHWTATCP